MSLGGSTRVPGPAVVLSGDPEVGAACVAALEASGDGPVVLLATPDVPDAALGAIEPVAAEHGPIATLVTVAGPGIARSVALAGTDDPFDEHVTRELATVHRAVRAVAPAMVADRGGRIVIVGATTALAGAPWETAHGAAMAGLVGLARSAARELASAGVTVNVVLAGAIDNEHLRSVRDRDQRGATAIEGAVAATPLRRLGTPEDVAGVVAFLASSDASYITGAVVPVDGGLAMGLG